MDAAAHDVIHREDPSMGADQNAPRIHELFAADMIAQAAQAIAASASSYNIGMVADTDAGHAVEQTSTTAATAAAASHTMHVNTTAVDTERHNCAPCEDKIVSAATNARSGIGGISTGNHPTAAVPASDFNHVPNLQTPPAETMTMDELLEEKKRAQMELNHAEEEIRRAEQLLDKATQHKLNIDARIKALTESSIDALLNESNRWNEMYKRLQEYKQEHGHCHLMRSPKQKQRKTIPRSENSSDKECTSLQALGTWARQVRLDARRPEGHPDRLDSYKILALDRLGFDWEPRENYWMDMYGQLKEYLKTSGGKMPPRFINNQKFALGQWCDTQLDNYRKLHSGKKGAYITPRKIEMLEQIGFVWDKRGHVWRENYERLKAFKVKYGHCNATTSKNGGDKSFGMWVTKQKGKYINWLEGKTSSKDLSLTDEQATLMDDIGFSECVELDRRKLIGRLASELIG